MGARNIGNRGFAGRCQRFAFETLEERALLSVMRLASWNTLNGPNDAAQQMAFETVLGAIGTASLAGNAQRVNLLAVQETDTPIAGGNSIGAIESILEGLYPSVDYATTFTDLDGGGDATGFVYDTTMLELLSAVAIEPMTLTHQVLRAQFRPVDTFGDSDFYAYSVHLKSGTGIGDTSIRTNEAALLRADADSLGEGANVLFVGDFNWQGSSEGAFQAFVAAGAGQVSDVVPNALGTWNDNPAFISLHTQDPGAAMDDRFDMQLASGEFYDGLGIDYVDDSYMVFGNNGTHTLNGAITTGTFGDALLRDALVAASDHLPTVADYSIATVAGVAIRPTGTGTRVIEGGSNDTYTVSLTAVPTANVTVTLTPDSQLDLGSGPGVATQLLFTPANALTRQTVVVAAVDDAIGEGNHTGLITHSSQSADSEYDGLTIDSLAVNIVDDDTPTIYINEIDSDTASTDMLEFVELWDGGVGNVSLAGMSLAFFNGANDDTAYRVIDLAPFSTDVNGFFVAGNAAVANVDFVFPSNILQNGADAVGLYAGIFPNNAAVTTANLLDAIVYDTGQADDAGLLVLLVGGGQLNENANGNQVNDALARFPDGGLLRNTTSWVAQGPTPGALNSPSSGGVAITQSGTGLNLAEGGPADSYQIVLNTLPTSDVTITITPDSQVDLGAGAGMAVALTFTPANYNLPQTVTATAFDDANVEGNHTSTIIHAASSSDPTYNAIAIASVVAAIVDNDIAPTPQIVISELMYDPASALSNREAEWIEVVNVGTAIVDLTNWLFDDEDATNWAPIPSGTMLAPGQVAVFVDAGFSDAATFRDEWQVPTSALVVAIGWGNLGNSPSAIDELLELRTALGAQVDSVNYDDSGAWPSNNGASSIYLTSLALDNNVGTSWARSATGVASALSPTGPTFSTLDVGSPGRLPGEVVVPLPGDYNADNRVDAADYTVWRDNLGATLSLPNDTTPGSVSQADYAVWRANFGNSLPASSAASLLLSVDGGVGTQFSAATEGPELDISGVGQSSGRAAPQSFAAPATSNGPSVRGVAARVSTSIASVDQVYADFVRAERHSSDSHFIPPIEQQDAEVTETIDLMFAGVDDEWYSAN